MDVQKWKSATASLVQRDQEVKQQRDQYCYMTSLIFIVLDENRNGVYRM